MGTASSLTRPETLTSVSVGTTAPSGRSWSARTDWYGSTGKRHVAGQAKSISFLNDKYKVLSLQPYFKVCMVLHYADILLLGLRSVPLRSNTVMFAKCSALLPTIVKIAFKL